MSRFTIITSVYGEYELLRQFIESIKFHVNPDSYEKVIVVDDFSINTGILRDYENFISASPEHTKFQIINSDEYRHARWYQSGFKEKEVSDKFDYRLFKTEKPSLGLPCSYQRALEQTNTEFVVMCDTDCVFLSKFQDTLNKIADLYDKYPKVMSISQLQGHSSDEIFETNVIGTKRIPAEIGYAGGPSTMFSTFRIEAWSKYKIVPRASTPERRRGTSLLDFFLSTIGMGFTVANFPFYSGDYVYHIGGGTARRNQSNMPNIVKPSYGSMNVSTHHYGAKSAFDTVYDYYAGAHYINLNSNQFSAYLQDKYNLPVNAPTSSFDENMLIKYKLSEDRDKEFRPMGENMIEHQLNLLSDAEEIQRYKKLWWDRYTYGKPSDINWEKIDFSKKVVNIEDTV